MTGTGLQQLSVKPPGGSAYDQYGNMSVTGNTGAVLGALTPQNGSVNPYNGNNQLASSLFSYDAAGNTTLLGSIGIQYDAENRQTQTNDPLLQIQANYGYDGLGQRVTKVLASGPTSVYVYDALGELASEYSTAVNTVPCSPCYLSYDHLGSVRMVTDQSGAVVSRHEYLPYGEELAGGSLGRSAEFGAADGVRQRFTGQERDGENTPALDYFNARYMASVLGRFASPDPGNAGASLTNPQSWNAYAYVGGNPLNTVDPSGMDGFGGGSGDDPCDDDPFCGGPIWNPLPPIDYPMPAPPPVTVEEPLPPGSFPGGESLGLPPGVQIPGPFGIGTNPLVFSLCPTGAPCIDPSVGPDLAEVLGEALSLARYGPWGVVAAIIFRPTPMTPERIWEIQNAKKRDLKQFQEAVRRYERKCNRILTDEETRRLHNAITKQGLTPDEIVEYAESIFGCLASPQGGSH